MNESQRSLVTAIRDYAQNTLDGKCLTEESTILSALVNLVDSAVEGNVSGYDPDDVQIKRESDLTEFLLAHDPHNKYSVTPYLRSTDPNNPDDLVEAFKSSDECAFPEDHEPNLSQHFEHGQWWIIDSASGATWSVHDLGDDDYDFERVTEGDFD